MENSNVLSQKNGKSDCQTRVRQTIESRIIEKLIFAGRVASLEPENWTRQAWNMAEGKRLTMGEQNNSVSRRGGTRRGKDKNMPMGMENRRKGSSSSSPTSTSDPFIFCISPSLPYGTPYGPNIQHLECLMQPD